MMRPVLLFLAIALGAMLGVATLGYSRAYNIAYGALAIMAVVIAMTFLWLWAARSTPLALGMAFSWTGAASLIGWWWAYGLLDAPDWMVENAVLFVFLALYFVGATMHLEVIGRSFGLSRRVALLPIWLAAALSAALALFF